MGRCHEIVCLQLHYWVHSLNRKFLPGSKVNAAFFCAFVLATAKQKRAQERKIKRKHPAQKKREFALFPLFVEPYWKPGFRTQIPTRQGERQGSWVRCIHLPAACDVAGPYFLSMLHVHCPCCMSLLHFYASSRCRMYLRQARAPCLSFMSELDVNDACHVSMLHVYAACPCCMSGQYFHAGCSCCCPRNMSMLLLHAACLWCMSVQHVHTLCPCCLSMPHSHVNAACPCYISMSDRAVLS